MDSRDLHDKELGIDTRASAPGLILGAPRAPSLISPSSVAVPPPGLPLANWYTNEDGGQQGPYIFALLNSRARQGTLSRETLVWAEGMSD